MEEFRCECVFLLFKKKKRIRNYSFVAPIMIKLKDRVAEYDRAFHSTVLKQTRIVSRLACSRPSVSESRTTSGGRAREKLGGFQSPLAPALLP